jgi:SulP family sulfate permease
MMIEAVPFFHILVNIIATEVGDDVSDLYEFKSYTDIIAKDAAIISTTMMAFAFSSILTGKSILPST